MSECLYGSIMIYKYTYPLYLCTFVPLYLCTVIVQGCYLKKLGVLCSGQIFN